MPLCTIDTALPRLLFFVITINAYPSILDWAADGEGARQDHAEAAAGCVDFIISRFWHLNRTHSNSHKKKTDQSRIQSIPARWIPATHKHTKSRRSNPLTSLVRQPSLEPLPTPATAQKQNTTKHNPPPSLSPSLLFLLLFLSLCLAPTASTNTSQDKSSTHRHKQTHLESLCTALDPAKPSQAVVPSFLSRTTNDHSKTPQHLSNHLPHLHHGSFR